MPSPPKKYAYNVIYNDGTYQTFEFTNQEIKSLEEAILKGTRAIKTSFGILVVTDIRTVAEHKEPPQVEPMKDEAMPPMDAETLEWIRQQEALAEELMRRGIN